MQLAHLKSPYFWTNPWYSSKTWGWCQNVLPHECTFQQKKLNLRIHHVRCHVSIVDMLSKLASKLCLDFLELQWLEGSTRTPINLGFVSYDTGAERLREPAHRLAKITLEKFHHRRRKVEVFRAIEDVLL